MLVSRSLTAVNAYMPITAVGNLSSQAPVMRRWGGGLLRVAGGSTPRSVPRTTVERTKKEKGVFSHRVADDRCEPPHLGLFVFGFGRCRSCGQ